MALLIGGTVFLAVCWPAGRAFPRARRIVFAGWGMAVFAALVGLVVHGPYVAGAALRSALQPQLLGATVTDRFGVMQLLRLALLIVALVLVRRSLLASQRPATGAYLTGAAVAVGLALNHAAVAHASAGPNAALAGPGAAGRRASRLTRAGQAGLGHGCPHCLDRGVATRCRRTGLGSQSAAPLELRSTPQTLTALAGFLSLSAGVHRICARRAAPPRRRSGSGPGTAGYVDGVNGVFLAHAGGGVHEIAVLLGPGLIILVLLLVLVARRREAGEDETSEERTHEGGRDGDN